MGVDPNIENKNGENVLFMAGCTKTTLEIIQFLIEHGHVSTKGETLLTCAASARTDNVDIC